MAAVVALTLFAGACGSGETAQVAEIVATANAPAATAIATTAPLQAAPAAAPEADAAPASEEVDQTTTAAPEATTAPAASVAEPTSAPQSQPTPIPPTAVPAPTAAPPAPTETPAPQAVTIGLPDVNVVNLLSRQTSSLAAYSPTGPTLLWFWAPH